MEFDEIHSILPQKFPLLMVDKVLEIVPNVSITCLKNITGNEMVFLGHFKDQAIFPGVYITEALAQSAIMLFHERNKNDDFLFLLYSTKMKFQSIVKPGDQLILKAESRKLTNSAAIVDVKALVEEKVAAKGEMMFAMKKNTDIR
jgi:3-hydroxyacyl-[acyl-carrier-protein] dehydratase